ncbi:NTP transferase domain-containing protein [Jeotgalibaca sp. MA1X17-3]|uniref:NTP transferase domain-containing protein n=1 Tax=Jeotgalibaca sp. MA1X17-3 TaxID=2908211 RepID=UPI001F3ED548|nr:NTP transferase domain-containing protein [Jeotgalibaca sp. MA1X17-3]UJF16462.1 NTP transferase domain-containing protein [Jeotgalibaca sp. MA1X17-3]
MKDIFELVYLIYEGKLKTQREFADHMFISLGKVNTLLKEAISKEYIVDQKGYKLMDKGQSLLSKHKVDNAIIMAAGFGSRFVPMTYETPKGLLEVHGEVMIERQIKQLHEVGITDITIVVGYLKEMFEYLTDLYGVKLIYNSDYSFKNNISSLYYAKEEMKNTYILTSDIYMVDNIYRKFENVSFYAAEYFEDNTDEWVVQVNKDNLITSINPSGGENTWGMYGPAFFKDDFSKKMVGYIDDIYEDKSCAQYYWENVYLNNKDTLDMFIRKYPKGTILEFESLEELRVYDKSYLKFSRSEILEVIKKVFDVELSDIVRLRTLKEGMTNDSFLFEVKGKKYVFRNPGKGTEHLINRNQEAHVYEMINPLHISDDVIYLNPEKGYKITSFVPNSRTIDPNHVAEVDLALEKLRILHGSGLQTKHYFDIEERIQFYHQLCIDSHAILFKDFDEVYENIKKVIDVLNSIPREKVLCHIDAVDMNFLLADGEITVLDWEYSGMADPLIDIAMFIAYANKHDQEINDLLDRYLEREHTKEELMIVEAYVSLAGFLWALWTQYKQACGEDFGTYGMEQHQYGRKYSRIVLDKVKNDA